MLLVMSILINAAK